MTIRDESKILIKQIKIGLTYLGILFILHTIFKVSLATLGDLILYVQILNLVLYSLCSYKLKVFNLKTLLIITFACVGIFLVNFKLIAMLVKVRQNKNKMEV